jgi:muramoyltetrapeptide carboxypeptidase
LVTAVLGTCHAPDFTRKVLVIEDINEPMYRIDRMLTHLKLSGALGKIAGLVLGHFVGPEGADLAYEVERLALQFTESNPIPVISGFPHGHRLPNLTLPFGVAVEMNTESRELVVLPCPDKR